MMEALCSPCAYVNRFFYTKEREVSCAVVIDMLWRYGRELTDVETDLPPVCNLVGKLLLYKLGHLRVSLLFLLLASSILLIEFLPRWWWQEQKIKKKKKEPPLKTESFFDVQKTRTRMMTETQTPGGK
jgi:hypothetical protein